MKHKKPMPRYYGKNIVQHAQKKFLQRKATEADREKRRECRDDLREERRLYEAEKAVGRVRARGAGPPVESFRKRGMELCGVGM